MLEAMRRPSWLTRRVVRRAVTVAVLSSAVVPFAVLGTIMASFIFLPLPASLPQARAAEGSQFSKVLDADGNQIAVFREFEQNIPVNKEDIPEHLKLAVIAAEDRSFYDHGGIDIRGTVRALWADVRNRGLVQGGSTITQQYVKNAYVGQERTVIRKVREAILASQLDRQLDKEQILFLYLSNVYLGEGAYGVGAASETYFRKPVSQVTISEAALLAGLIPAPSRYEPRGNPELAESKRKLVLRLMLEEGSITQAQHDEALAQPVWLATQGPPPGPVTLVHPPQVQQTQFPYFVDYVRRYLIERYGPEKVFRGGLTIQTTLDARLQGLAEKVVADSLKGTASPIEMSLVSVEPQTGYVKALVGGRDFYNGPFAQVNLALGGCPRKPAEPDVVIEVAASCWEGDGDSGGGAGRQPGSSWKPFVLAAAFAKGVSPSKTYPAPNEYRIPGCEGDKCTIGNYEGASFGTADLRRATWKSINTVYAQLINDVGIKETAEMAKKLGIRSAWESPRFHGISYSLGVLDVSPLDMASAYGVFAARGLRAAPTPIVKVVDAEGRTLEDNFGDRAERVLDEVVADNVTDVLKGVITSGTGGRADIGRPAAGKTGTAQAYRDAWFVGYTPTLSTSVWIGNAEKPTPLTNIRGVRNVAGGTIPAQTWHDFMGPALEGVKVTEFSEPAPIAPLADAIKRAARGDIDPGPQRQPEDIGPGGEYLKEPAAPEADVPTTTTTTFPTSSTTSTTRPGFPRP